MAIRSPFDGLRIPRELVCDFFATFSRMEFALKELGFVKGGLTRANPDWDRFAREVAPSLRVARRSELAAAIGYLTAEPPQVQTVLLTWQHAALAGETATEQAIHAITRVRNNLFHGGKHTSHSPPGRDEKLVRASLHLMYATLEQNERLREAFEQREP